MFVQIAASAVVKSVCMFCVSKQMTTQPNKIKHTFERKIQY